MSALLDVQHLTVRFGGLTAVRDFSMQVHRGEIVSLIGPNGAGKTTVFNAVTGVHAPNSGAIAVDGVPLKRALTPATVMQWAAIGVTTGVLATVTVNIEAVWAAAITQHYRMHAAFPWAQALRDGVAALAPTTGTVVPALVGTVIGGLAGWSVWQRSRVAPELAVRGGLARTFQNIRLFRDLTVLDNVLVGMDSHLRSRPWDAILLTPRQRRERVAALAEARQLLALVGLSDDLNARAGSLPYGHQRRLEIARALATKPRVLLLDEPAAGMNPAESEALMALIRRIRDGGVTVLLIEHDMRVVMGISDRVVVLNHGEKLAEGTPAQVRADPKVVEAYLGKDEPATNTVRRAASIADAASPLLKISNLSAGYGPINALHDVSLELHAGELVTLIGANGAGKTTLLACCAGIHRAASGTVCLRDQNLVGDPAHRVLRHGVALVPEGRRVFPRLSVRENLELGAYTRSDDLSADLERIFTLFPVLAERRHQLAGTLSGGEQQMLAIGRALMSRPTVLLMDEPSMGVAPLIAAKILDTIRQLNRDGLTVLLVEQNARLALSHADRGYVLEHGRIVLSDRADRLLADERVRAAYLGEG